MSTRTWPLPNLRSGTTIHHITDTHFGQRFFTASWMDQVGADLDRLKVLSVAHVNTGDHVQWQLADLPEDDQVLAWLAARKAVDATRPWVMVPGNHDLSSYFRDLPRRSAAQWAAAMGMPSHNTVTTIGSGANTMRVLGVGPDTWDSPDAGANVGDCVLSPATLKWLDEQLTAAGSTPCWIACHAPLYEQYDGLGGIGWYVNPRDVLANLLSSHPNAIGWLSGHRHVNVQTEPSHARSAPVGSRRMFHINSPAACGRRNDLGFDDHQLLSPCQSMYVTYLGDAVDVRWREHLRRRWDTVDGSRVKHILLAA